MESGIYIITNLIDNKIYIGRSKEYKKRLKYHYRLLKLGNHPNEHLQNAVIKYGIRNFTFDLLEEVEDIEYNLSSMEHYWCNLLQAHNDNYGYNIKPTHPYDLFLVAKETGNKISDSKMGYKHTQEAKDNISKGKKGKISCPECIKYDLYKYRTEETFKKIADSKKGKSRTKEAKKAISKSLIGRKAWNKGLKMTEEYSKNISNGKKTKKKVQKFTLNNLPLEVFDSICDAAKNVNGLVANISQCCYGKLKTSYGFKWKFFE